MTYRYYQIYEYGFVVPEEDIVFLAKKLKPEIADELITDELSVYAEEVASHFGLTYEACFSGTVTPIDKSGNEILDRSERRDDAILLMVPTANEPSPVAPPTQSMKVMIHNAKCYLGKAMPVGYNFADNICHVVGTTFRVNGL